MIEITVDTASPSPSGLVVGCRVEYGKGGAIRFVQMRIPWSVLTYELLQQSMKHWDREAVDTQHDPGLF